MAAVESKRGDGVMLIRMNPIERLNALGIELRSALAETWCEFRDSCAVGVSVFTGARQAFSVGADLNEALQTRPDGIAACSRGEALAQFPGLE